LIILAITGCSTNPPLKTNPTLPKIKELRSLSDRDAIALEWDIINKPQVYGYYIQRSKNAKKYTQIAKINSKYVAHFVDTHLKPNTIYYYKISSFDKKGLPSFAIFKKAKTLPTLQAVPFIANAGIKARAMIKLIFRPHPNERVKGYYIQRFNDTTAKWDTIATLHSRLDAEYIDKNLIDGKVYRYRVIAYSYDNLKSTPSKVITAQTLQRPQAIVDLIASTSLPKRIVLNWQKVKGAIEYKIYKSNTQNGPYTLLATTKANSFVDIINKDGFTRFYKVSSVDKYNIESIPSQPVMGVTLPIPAKPIVSLERDLKTLKFILSSPDKRAVKYIIKKYMPNSDKPIQINDIKGVYVDKDVAPKHTYKYEIYAVDENGLISNPTTLEVDF